MFAIALTHEPQCSYHESRQLEIVRESVAPRTAASAAKVLTVVLALLADDDVKPKLLELPQVSLTVQAAYETWREVERSQKCNKEHGIYRGTRMMSAIQDCRRLSEQASNRSVA